jgi:hypothetical protein
MWTYPTLPGGNTLTGSEAVSDSFTVNDAPNAPTNFDCITIGDGSLTYSWSLPSSSGYNDPTNYYLSLSDGQYVDINASAGGNTTSYTFSGLTNGTSYNAEIYAYNQFGSSSSTTTGPNEPLGPISYPQPDFVGPSQGTPVSGLYPITVSWTGFSQAGYTLVDYTVRVHRVSTGLVEETLNFTNTTYTYNNGELAQSYYFEIIANATINQVTPSVSVSISVFSGSLLVADVPAITNVGFNTDSNGNGVIYFDVDSRGSAITGIMSVVLPEFDTSVPTAPFQISYTPYLTGNNTYTANLGYSIPPTNPSYVIYAVNGVGGTAVDGNFSA